MEVVAHGQELDSDFLDSLFTSVLEKVPEGKWVKISKNHDAVVAGLKHLIDMSFYGEKIDVSFNDDYTYFKKTIVREPVKQETPARLSKNGERKIKQDND